MVETFCNFTFWGFAGRILQGWRARIANGSEHFFLGGCSYIESCISSPLCSGHELFEHPRICAHINIVRLFHPEVPDDIKSNGFLYQMPPKTQSDRI